MRVVRGFPVTAFAVPFAVELPLEARQGRGLMRLSALCRKHASCDRASYRGAVRLSGFDIRDTRRRILALESYYLDVKQ